MKHIAEWKDLVITVSVIIIVATSVAVFAEVPNVFSPGTVAKSSQVNENFSYLADRLLARTVIEGTIDTSQDGDVVKTIHSSNTNIWFVLHWKTVDVSQITLTNMPMAWVYMKALPNTSDLPATNN